ncbi:MAG: hypothetical protein IJ557_08035 [Bacteroidaceae bacterium]|nr:hypothetical protein [Bacteroidaceae bacterium]
MKVSFSFLLLICIFAFFSCQSYERKRGCHLDKMHIKGNVVKIETIVQSTMPLTEIYAKAFDPQYAISAYAGNITIDFDFDGNIKHSEGYGIDGKKIFEAYKYTPDNDGCSSPAVLTGPRAKQNIDNIKTITSENGDVVNIKYFNGDKLIWNQKAFYNEDGSVKSIVKDYNQLSIHTDLIHISRTDTTTFNYIRYDNHGNWTEVEISYKGILPEHDHSYRIKRQITYLEDDKKPALIEELAVYNKAKMTSTDEMYQVFLGGYGTMKIPHYMSLQSREYINEVKNFNSQSASLQTYYIFLSMYNNKDAYATISAHFIPGDGSNGYDDMSPEELEYNEELDRYIEEQNTTLMAQGGTYVLKWLPYKFTTISGHRALKVTYYRYGNGSPIPVYCESYTIPMVDGNTICVMFSIQSNLYNRFYVDFEQSINSIRFQ